MKRLLLAGAFALVAGGQPLAADLPPAAAAPPPRAPATYAPTTAPVYNWSGAYIGLNGGYAFGDSDWTGAGASSGSFNTAGGLAGGTFGANFQAGPFVFGAETDVDWTDIKGSTASAPCGGPIASCQTANSWLGTVRGRAGYALDRILVFGTAGTAFGNIEASNPGGAPGTDTTNKIGWTAGGGVEVAIIDNLTARLEYLYVDLGSGSCPTVCGTPGPSIAFTANLIRLGVDYKFGVQ